MPRPPDDETLLARSINSGPSLSKTELFRRAAIIMQYIKQYPGQTSGSVARAVAPLLEMKEGTLQSYLPELEKALLLKNKSYRTEEGSLHNAWYLADWLLPKQGGIDETESSDRSSTDS